MENRKREDFGMLRRNNKLCSVGNWFTSAHKLLRIEQICKKNSISFWLPSVRINTTITIPLINMPNKSVASHAISVRSLCTRANFVSGTEIPCPNGWWCAALSSNCFELSYTFGQCHKWKKKKKTFKAIDSLESSCHSRIYAKYSIWPI